MRIGIGADQNGAAFKEEIKMFIEKTTDHKVKDFGCAVCEEIDYPEVAYDVAKAISEGELDRGILICGTGIGVAIAAGKYPGIRAALTHDTYSAERAQLSNNAQIITMGAQIIGVEVGKKVVESYLSVEWAKGSERKVNKIKDIENKFFESSSN